MKNNFQFVKDRILNSNLETAFTYVLTLITLLESPTYDEEIKSSFRKNIIIYTASIIEALLLYKVKVSLGEGELKNTVTKVKVLKDIYEVEMGLKYISLVEKVSDVEELKLDKLNLDQIAKVAKKNKLIDLELFNKIDKVRKLRNKLHIGTLVLLDNSYDKKDLEFVFSVAKDVKNIFYNTDI